MQRYLCYILLLLIALPAWSVHVPVATTEDKAATTHQHQPAAAPEHSCHSTPNAVPAASSTDNAEHDCCNGDQQHQCDNKCTTQHCSANAALLMVSAHSNSAFLRDELNDHQSLPEWLFFKDPPPPVNA